MTGPLENSDPGVPAQFDYEMTPEEVLTLHVMRAHDLAATLRALIEATAPLMDLDYCQPFSSAWELDWFAGSENRDGEVVYEQVKAAWEQAKAVLNA